MPKPLKKQSLPSRRNRPNYGLSSGEFLPRFNTDCRDGRAIAREGKEAVELEMPVKFEVDFEATQCRLRKFEGGKVVDGGVYNGGRYEDDFRPAIIAPIYGGEPLDELGGRPLGMRTYESSAYAAREAWDRIDDYCYGQDPGGDQVAVLQLNGFEKVSYRGGRSSQQPVWELVGWKPRRTEFKDYAVKQQIGVTYDTDELNDELPPEVAADTIEV